MVRTPRSSSKTPAPQTQAPRTAATVTHVGLDTESIRQDVLDKLQYVQARFSEVATRNDWYLALAYAVRDRLLG